MPRRHPFQYAQFSLADDAFCPSPTSHSAKRHPADGHAQLGNCRTHLFEVSQLRHLDTLYIWNPALIAFLTILRELVKHGAIQALPAFGQSLDEWLSE